MKNSLIKQCIVDALISLMKERDLKDISITELTNKAGVSRMSYYRNYYSKEDVLHNYISEILVIYMNDRQELIDNNKGDIYNLIYYAFTFFERYKDFVLTVEKSNYSNIFQNRITEFMEKLYPEDNSTFSKYNLYIFSGSLYNVCKMWLVNGMIDDPHELAHIYVDRLFKN